MYKIGEFSKITNLTVKALRYYDEENILKPTTYLENGYRLYNDENFNQAKRIRLLRDLNFTIQEIKDALEYLETDDDLQYYLLEKKENIHTTIIQQKSLLKKIDSYLLPNIQKGDKTMSYQMSIKEVKEVTVASIRYQDIYQNMGDYISKIYKYLKSNADNPPFACYYDGEYKEKADTEICVPIKKEMAGNNEIIIKTLPAIKALTTTHVGSYDTLSQAYKAIMDYAKENNIELLIPSREVYLKGPGMVLKGNPEKYITEIYIPIKM